MTISYLFNRRFIAAFLSGLAMTAILTSSAPAQAVVHLEIEDAIFNVNSPAAVEVVLRIDQATSQRLAAYNIGLDILPAEAAALMTNAIETTDHTPIFPGQAPLVPFTGQSLRAADNLALGGADLFDQAGLIRVLLSIDPSIAGQQFTINFDPQTTFLFDESAAPIVLSSLDGAIITVVPEMGTLTLCGLSAVMIAGITWRRSARRSARTD